MPSLCRGTLTEAVDVNVLSAQCFVCMHVAEACGPESCLGKLYMYLMHRFGCVMEQHITGA